MIALPGFRPYATFGRRGGVSGIHHMRMIGAGLLLALLLAGCATATLEPGQIANIKRVAIISALGDRFAVKKLGITIFNNDERDFPADAWGVDDAVVSTVRGVVGQRFEVRPVTYQRSAFYVADNSGPAVAEAVRSHMSAQDIDAYIVITKGSSRVGDSNFFVSGLGILEGDSLVMHSTTVYAIYWVTVVDGHRFTVIGNMPAWSIGQSLSAISSAVHGPNREVDNSLRPTTLDAAANPKLREIVLGLLQQNLPTTLQNLKILQ